MLFNVNIIIVACQLYYEYRDNSFRDKFEKFPKLPVSFSKAEKKKK